jgi:glycerate kinase
LYSGAVRVLVTPDKFKGTLTAVQAAEAIAGGWARAVPSADVEQVPMADGGEGTLDALVAALGGERHRARVTGPLGDPVDAEYAMANASGEPLAVIEMARASGLTLISERRRDPKRTTTRGTGELILEACRRGSRRVLVCIGGSATNDAGAGMAQALGIRLLDERWQDLGPGGAALVDLARIDMSGLDPAVAAATFLVATDVDNPLVGPQGASAVYGPQKGASPEDVAMLDRALGHFAAVVYRDLGLDVRDLPGAGAAGGLGAGLMAFLGARLRPGVDVVMESLRLPQRLQGADLVVTGEGRFDQQSLRGKVPAGVLRVAEEARVRAVVLCGQADIEPPGVRVFSLAERFGAEAAMERSGPLLEELAAEVAASIEREQGDRNVAEGRRGRSD